MGLFKKKRESYVPFIGIILALVPVFAFVIMAMFDSYVPYWIYQGIDRNITYLLVFFILIAIISIVLGIKAITEENKKTVGISTLTIDTITITFNAILLILVNDTSINFNNYSYIYSLSTVINKGSVAVACFLAALFIIVGGYRIIKSDKKTLAIVLYILGVMLACLAFVGINFVLLFL